MTIRIGLGTSIMQPISLGGATIGLMMLGDSLTQAGFELASDYQTALSSYNVTASVFDAATGGLKLQNFWDPVDDTKAASYTSLVDGNANKGDTTDVIISLGVNDANDIIQADYTIAQWKTAYQSMIDELSVSCPKLERIYIRLIGRHTSNSTTNINDAYESIRQAQLELIDANLNCYMSSPHYDVDYQDSFHPTDNAEGYGLLANRESARIAFTLSQFNKPSLGAEVTSASVDGLGILLNLSLDNGTDITVPTAGQGLDGYLVNNSQTPILQLDRVDASTVRINTGAPWSNTPSIETVEGSLNGLGLTSVPFVRENGDLKLPILPAQVTAGNTFKNNDEILQLTDLGFYVKAGDYTKEYTTGTEVNKIYSVNGTSFSSFDSDVADMDFDSTAFDNAGGLTGTTTRSGLTADQNILDMTSGGLTGFVIEVNESSATKVCFYLGSSTNAFNNAGLYIQSGILRYAINQSGSVQNIFSGISNGDRLAVILDYQSASVLNIYVNNGSTPAATFDPNNDSVNAAATRLWINTRGAAEDLSSTSNMFGTWFGKSGAHNASNDPAIADIMDQMKTDYGIT